MATTNGIVDIYNFLKGKVFYPATVDENGKPRVRPFGAVALYERKLYLCTNSEKNVSRQLKNGDVEIAATAENGEWIRVSAKAVLDPTAGAKKQLFDENPRLKEIYAGRENLFEAFYLASGTATLLDIAGTVKWTVKIGD